MKCSNGKRVEKSTFDSKFCCYFRHFYWISTRNFAELFDFVLDFAFRTVYQRRLTQLSMSINLLYHSFKKILENIHHSCYKLKKHDKKDKTK